jgi:hypothetical protein
MEPRDTFFKMWILGLARYPFGGLTFRAGETRRIPRRELEQKHGWTAKTFRDAHEDGYLQLEELDGQTLEPVGVIPEAERPRGPFETARSRVVPLITLEKIGETLGTEGGE